MRLLAGDARPVTFVRQEACRIWPAVERLAAEATVVGGQNSGLLVTEFLDGVDDRLVLEKR